MNLGILSVSYLNDCKSHAEWLHPFYNSLSSSLKNSDLNVVQFVVLNDDNKEEAKKNIQQVVSSYDFGSFRQAFINPETNYTLDPDIHHARGLDSGIKSVNNNYSNLVKRLDFFVVEEFDVIHKDNFSTLISDFYTVSNKFESFFGVIGTGKYRMNYNYYGHEEDYIGIYDQPPRVAPLFLGFNVNMMETALSLFGHFETKFLRLVSVKSNSISKGIKDKGLNFPFFVDELCGCDLFYEMISKHNFFHLEGDRPISHIGGVTMDYKRLLRKSKVNDLQSDEVRITRRKLEKKFSFVKEKIEYNFPESSIFFKKDFEQDFDDLDPEKYNYN